VRGGVGAGERRAVALVFGSEIVRLVDSEDGASRALGEAGNVDRGDGAVELLFGWCVGLERRG
jgi:hypothetical protein